MEKESNLTPEQTKDWYKNREFFFTVDDNGNVGHKIDYHPPTDQIFIAQCWEVFNERMEDARQQCIAGKASPILYYMEKNLMDISFLAANVEMSKWRVRRHLKPGVFNKLKPEILNRYANVFRIDIETLKQVK